MELHWTYEEVLNPDEDLRQGDILRPNPELYALLKSSYPEFSDLKYIGFMVTTQCCDLVRRKGELCKADFITVAVAQNLDTVIDGFLESICPKVTDKVYLQKNKIEATQLLHRIFNQNEQALGLFYLEPSLEDNMGIWAEAVVFLRNTITFPRDHYKLLVNARAGRITSEFRNKVGWLVSNLYSRIGTKDWAEMGQEKALNEKILRFLDRTPHSWIDESWVRFAQKEANQEFDGLTTEEVINLLEQHKPQPFKERIGAEAATTLNKLIEALPKSVAGNAVNSIADLFSSQGFTVTRSAVRNTISDGLKETFHTLVVQLAKDMSDRLLLDAGVLDVTSDFRDQLQSELEYKLYQAWNELPNKLSTRLTNSQILKAAVDKADVRS